MEHTGFEPVTSTMRIDLDAPSGLTMSRAKKNSYIICLKKAIDLGTLYERIF